MSQHTQHADLSGLGASDEPPYTWRTLLLSLFMVAFVVLLLSFAQESDERAAAELQRLAHADESAQGMPMQMARAYERGMADAMDALRHTPSGTALAQACTAQAFKGAQP